MYCLYLWKIIDPWSNHDNSSPVYLSSSYYDRIQTFPLFLSVDHYLYNIFINFIYESGLTIVTIIGNNVSSLGHQRCKHMRLAKVLHDLLSVSAS